MRFILDLPDRDNLRDDEMDRFGRMMLCIVDFLLKKGVRYFWSNL